MMFLAKRLLREDEDDLLSSGQVSPTCEYVIPMELFWLS